MRRAILTVLSTVAGLVLLLSLKSHNPSAATVPAAGPSGTSGSSSRAGSSDSSTSTPSGSSSGTSSGASSAGTKTVTGNAVDTRWGPVQVRVSLVNGKISSVTAVEYPDGNGRDQEINSYALPVLAQEAVSANSADIDMVSGATYTSQGYISSLQSALDQVR
jgi:uncharacterized protein with FMN-binding domain